MLEEITVKNSGYVTLPKILDDRDGALSIMEVKKDISFEIKRVYYINHLENCVSVRGKHAHKELEQVIFCLNGCFTLGLDDGEKQQEVQMIKDNVGVILGKELWHVMHSFSNGCIILVVASDVYDESDYIRDYEQFLQYVGERK